MHGEDIMLKFTALESALIDQPKAPSVRDNVREVDRDDISEKVNERVNDRVNDRVNEKSD